MSLDTAFQVAFVLSILGWVLLFLFPRRRAINLWICAWLVPAVFAVAYCVLCVMFWTQASGGFFQRFGSLTEVLRMFGESKGLLFAGWVHYLCFDLFIGAWEARYATAVRMPYLVLFPCLLLTLLFGPAGLLLFQIVLLVTGRHDAVNAETIV
jgi:hypothetical protein